MAQAQRTGWQPRWLEENLVCPYDGTPLRGHSDTLRCGASHSFPVVHGIPVLLREDLAPTHHAWRTTVDDVARFSAMPPPTAATNGSIDPFVEQRAIWTCGRLYRRRSAPFSRYPIPDIGLPASDGQVLLDVGSNWGRWAIAAAQLGYRVVALDPSLEATLAGVRVTRQLDLPVAYVVGDARCLPFRSRSIDVGHSNGVLQHLDKEVVRQALRELNRVTRHGGRVRIQMPNALGVLRLFNHAREEIAGIARRAIGRGRAPYPFRIRPWTPNELLATFRELIGPSTLSADGYFSLNARAGDADLVNATSAMVIRVSRALCAASLRVPGLPYLADSVVLDASNR